MVRRKAELPRGILKTAVVDPSRYRYERYHPSADLDLYVEHYWSVEWDLRGRSPERAETLPHPSVHVIFERGGKSRIRGPARAKFSRVLSGTGGVFAIKFTPAGFYPFVRVAVSRFTDAIVSLRDVFGAAGDSLARAVDAEQTDLGRTAVVETFLRSRCPTPNEHSARVSEIVYAVAKDPRITKVQDLVARYNLTTRTLQRLFATYVGVNPKWVIQRYRLHEAAEQLAGDAALSHSALAASLGYSDQAHFIRDFRAIVGASPAAYARAARKA